MRSKPTFLALALAGLLITGCQSAPRGGESGTGPAPAAPATASASGEETLQAVGRALSKATSWRTTSTTDRPGEVEVTDIVCPDKMKQVTPGGLGRTTIRIGEDEYVKAGEKWIKISASGRRRVCPHPWSDPLLTSSKITKGGTATVEGESCQEWIIEGVSLSTVTMCVGSDNLPRQVKARVEDKVFTDTYSNWNKPAIIEAPK